MKLLLAIQPTVKLDPDPGKFPGGGIVQDFADGIAGVGLTAVVAIFAFGAVMWALSPRGGNVGFTSEGKSRVLAAAVAALLIAGAPAFINFFIGLAQDI
ncbi:MAG: DUF6112 family protein [Actinomycetota bacterium]|nr:DUF6112 family protein [Actinomycetota bacterium]